MTNLSYRSSKETVQYDIDEKQSVAAPAPGWSRSHLRSPSKTISWDVRKIPPKESFHILKNLLVKAVESDVFPSLDEAEYLVLFQCHENLTREFPSPTYFSYAKKQLINLLDVTECLLKWNSSSKTKWQMIRDQITIFKKMKVLPSGCAHFGWRGTWNVERFLVRINRNLRRKSPERRWMGVGHRDTGTARDVSYDASPHWSEVRTKMTSMDFSTASELLEEQLSLMGYNNGRINLAAVRL